MTHYCDAGNRQRFERKLSPDGKSVEFNLLDITSKRFVLAPWERNVLDFPIISGNIALRWSAGRG